MLLLPQPMDGYGQCYARYDLFHGLWLSYQPLSSLIVYIANFIWLSVHFQYTCCAQGTKLEIPCLSDEQVHQAHEDMGLAHSTYVYSMI